MLHPNRDPQNFYPTLKLRIFVCVYVPSLDVYILTNIVSNHTTATNARSPRRVVFAYIKKEKKCYVCAASSSSLSYPSALTRFC